jgi:hypothetical protein
VVAVDENRGGVGEAVEGAGVVVGDAEEVVGGVFGEEFGMEVGLDGEVDELEVAGGAVGAVFVEDFVVGGGGQAAAEDHGAGAGADVDFGAQELGQQVAEARAVEDAHEVIGVAAEGVDDVVGGEALLDGGAVEGEEVDDLEVAAEGIGDGGKLVRDPAMVDGLDGVGFGDDGDVNVGGGFAGEAGAGGDEVVGGETAGGEEEFHRVYFNGISFATTADYPGIYLGPNIWRDRAVI